MEIAMKTPTLILTVMLALLPALSGCGGEAETPVDKAARHTVQAITSVVQLRETPAYSIVPGTVVAIESVKVASRLMGYIKDIAVAEGESVKAGQRLFSIDPLDIEGAVSQARLGLQQAEDAMRDAKADYLRFENLYKDEVVTRQQYEKMKLNYDIAVSRAAQAKAGLGTAQGQMRYATVTSPINGIVTQKLANEGDIAAPGHPVLMVENPAKLQIQTSVSDEVFRSLKLGQAITVEVDGFAEALPAKVARLSPAADPMSHSFMVKLEVAGVGLKSGAFARVLFPTDTRTVLDLPAAAVLDRAGITGLFVVDSQGVAQYRMIRTGRSENGRVEILTGLNPGERVVTGNAQAVTNGDKVVDQPAVDQAKQG